MSKRHLHCENGNHPWERESQRGRLPRNCPQHPNPSGTPTPTPAGPRTVPVKVVEGSEQGDAAIASRKRAEELVIAMKALEGRERKVIEH